MTLIGGTTELGTPSGRPLPKGIPATAQVLVAAAAVLLSACGESDEVEAASTGSADPCQLLTPSMIKQAFPGAKDVTRALKERNYPLCKIRFAADDKNYRIYLTLAAGKGSEAGLERAVSVFDQASPVAGLGDGAYYVDKVHQVSARAGGDLFHLALEYGLSGNRDKTVELARRVAEGLD